MSEEQPLWRQGFDVAERAVATRLEEVIGSERFAIAVGLASQAQRAVQRRTEKTTRRLLHIANLPAGSDITRILNELAQLQRQVRELSKQAQSAQSRPAPAPSAAAARPSPGAQASTTEKPKEVARGSRDDGQTRPGRPGAARR